LSEPVRPAPRWLRQADVFERLTKLPVAIPGGVEERPVPHGVAVITQTCDAVRPGVAYVQVAPVVRLSGPDVPLAASGRSPLYAPLPGLGPDAFARLDLIATIGRDMLVESARCPGVVELVDVRRFAQAVGRRFERFAFPDDAAAWLKPLQELAQKRAGKQSVEGRAFSKVDEIRIRSHSGWSTRPYVLTISFIVRPGVLPIVDDDSPDAPLANLTGATPLQIAETLESATGGVERLGLWDVLGRGWVAACAKVEGAGSAVVESWDVEVVAAMSTRWSSTETASVWTSTISRQPCLARRCWNATGLHSTGQPGCAVVNVYWQHAIRRGQSPPFLCTSPQIKADGVLAGASDGLARAIGARQITQRPTAGPAPRPAGRRSAAANRPPRAGNAARLSSWHAPPAPSVRAALPP
jgi:hypothetical protein